MKIGKKIIEMIRQYKFFCTTRCLERPKILGKIYVNNKNVTIGKNVILYPGVVFWGDGEIVIGDNCKIGNNVMIYASKNGGGVCVGEKTLIAANCYIIDVNHGTKLGIPIMDQPVSAEPIFIGYDCWLGENVTMIKGSSLGDGCVVGAKSLVNHRFESNSIIVGIPAKTIGKRS